MYLKIEAYNGKTVAATNNKGKLAATAQKKHNMKINKKKKRFV